jgi:hypothetical protein
VRAVAGVSVDTLSGESVALLAAAAWACRLLAGRVFGAAMHMYGEEPSLREMVRWMRQG